MNTFEIKLLKPKTREVITTETYELKVNGKKIIYIEYLNESGRVIDEIMRDEKGNDIYDAILLEEIQAMFP